MVKLFQDHLIGQNQEIGGEHVYTVKSTSQQCNIFNIHIQWIKSHSLDYFMMDYIKSSKKFNWYTC